MLFSRVARTGECIIARQVIKIIIVAVLLNPDLPFQDHHISMLTIIMINV